MRWWMAAAIATTVGAATPLSAQPCPPPPELAAWARPAPLSAAMTVDDKPVPFLVVGRAAATTLPATEQVRFVGVPGHRTGAIRYAGLVALDVRLPGTYRLALGGPAWIDMLSNERPLEAIAHGHGSECSSVRKMVDFRLTPGRYVVQLSDAPSPILQAMIVRIGA